jgi:hypothetical protein
MPPEELRTALRQQPFVPLRLHLTDGRSFDVSHPENLMVGARVAVVGVFQPTHANGQTFFDYTETITLVHIVSLEPIGQTA